MRIERIAIKNYKILKDVVIDDLPAMSVFVGKNGAGKSTLFDVFAFLQDSLRQNVTVAIQRRGGFKELVSRGTEGPVSLEIKFRGKPEKGKSKAPIVTYELVISWKNAKANVDKEVFAYRRGSRGKPWHFIDFKDGEGDAIVENETTKSEKDATREHQQLESPDILAVKGLGQFSKFTRIAEFRKLLENWHISKLDIDTARVSPDTGVDEHLSSKGDNIALVTKHLYENHRETFDEIVNRMVETVPGITGVTAEQTVDGRILLRFQNGEFKDPFLARYISDGTMKMFAYLVLIHDPKPRLVLCVEEPENYLYPTLVQRLAEEFRDYANPSGQVFVSSHSYEFVNALNPEELFWMRKAKDGFTEVKRASDSDLVNELKGKGEPLGELWHREIFPEDG